MAKNEKKIRRAADLHFSGESYQSIGEALSVGHTTVYRWSKSQIWADEIATLRAIQVEEHKKIFGKNLEKHRQHLESAATASIQISIGLLLKLKKLTDAIDVENLEDTEKQIQSLKTLAGTYDSLLSGGKILLTEAMGVDHLIETMAKNGLLDER